MILKPFKRESIMPLPVAFISTISTAGIRNIAPYSCVMPVLRPLDLVCVASAHRRDTLKNIWDTNEFVLNFPGLELADKVIPTARYTAPEVDEFDLAGLSEKPSDQIKAPGILECYAWMECKFYKAYTEDQYVLIMGQVVHLEVADEVYLAEGSLDVKKARPLFMTSSKKGMKFCTVVGVDKFELYGSMFPNGKDPLAHKYEA